MSHFPRFSFFLTIFHAIQCLCFIFLIFQFSCHIPCGRVFVFHFPRFSFISPYSRSDSVFVTFSTFCIFIAIYQVRQCAFLIFHVIHCFSPYSTFYGVCFPFCSFSVFLAIFQVLPCEFLIFHVFQCFSPYSRSKCVFL